MRTLRERPRVVAAQLLAGAALLGVGWLIGSAAADDGDEIPPKTAAELRSAKRQARVSQNVVRERDRDLSRTRRRVGRLEGRTDRLRRTNRGLRRDLARTRRALRRERQATD